MNVCFVSEHGSKIGDGHISRQIAIAEWLAENKINIDLFTNKSGSFFAEKFRALGAGVFEIEFGAALFKFPLDHDAAYEWCFIGGDQISNHAELAIKNGLDCRTVRVSDIPIHYRHSDVLINQNFGSEKFDYSDVPGQMRFLGLKHVMLRELIRNSEAGLPGPENKLITISLGNSTGGKISALLTALINYFSEKSFDNFSFDIFTNARTEPSAPGLWRDGINISPPSDDFIASMKGSEFVICSVGTSMWECMSLGIPYIAVPLNDAQARYVKTLEIAGICKSLEADDVLQGSSELTKVIDHCRDKKEQINYRSLYKKLMPGRYFLALEEILELDRSKQTLA